MSILRCRACKPLALANGEFVQGCATTGSALVVGTSTGRLVCEEHATHVFSPDASSPSASTVCGLLAVCTARVTTLGTNALPESSDYALALVAGHGIELFKLPHLEAITWPDLIAMSKAVRLIAVDQLAESNPSEYFRVATVIDNSSDPPAQNAIASSTSTNIPGRSTKTATGNAIDQTTSVLALYKLKPGDNAQIVRLGFVDIAAPIISVSFGGMTIVVTTAEHHFMVRVARDGSLAVAAQVSRFQLLRRQGSRARSMSRQNRSSALASLLSGIGGLFSRSQTLDNAIAPIFATPLPDDRWLLVVDMELEAYSSFGARIEEMQNVFKSKAGLALIEDANADIDSASPSTSVLGSANVLWRGSQRGCQSLARSASNSSLGSAATAHSSKPSTSTNATRSEKLPLDAVYVSPLVLSMTRSTSLIAFAANGSVSGGLQALTVSDTDSHTNDEDKSTDSDKRGNPDSRPSDRDISVRLVPCADSLPLLAYVVWPSGRLVGVELQSSLSSLIAQYEQDGEYAHALALVPTTDVERTLHLRRMLASEARFNERHEEAIKHMECIVNISMKSELYSQTHQDLLIEAAELRGSGDSTWRDDPVNAAMWADFLYQLRRRVMRPSSADAAILDSLCAVDVSASRIRSFLSVPHSVSVHEGESLIISSQCALSEQDRMAALVALYQSVGAHDKALCLLEESRQSINDVCDYLSHHMDPETDADIFFRHLDRLALDASRHDALLEILLSLLTAQKASSRVMAESFKFLVRGPSYLIPTYVEHVLTFVDEQREKDIEAKNNDLATCSKRNGTGTHRNVLDTPLLAAMITARQLDKMNVVDEIRTIYRTHVLQHAKTDEDVKTTLAKLRECNGLELHEELAFLLGQQGEHSMAAAELAAEDSMTPVEALKRLKATFPPAMHNVVASSLASAYLTMAAKGHSNRAASAAEVVALEPGHLDTTKILRDVMEREHTLRVQDAYEFANTAIATSTERLRTAQILRAVRKSELRTLKEDFVRHRRKHLTVSRDQSCAKCGRALGEAVFVAHTDGNVLHLVCHLSSAAVAPD